MSSKNNVNPDYYKIAGRERQGEDIVHDIHKRRYTLSKTAGGPDQRNFIPGAEEENVSEAVREAEEADRKEGEETA